MIPTRQEIQDKINSFKNVKSLKFFTREEVNKEIDKWLTELKTPNEDKEKILDDLVSYENY